jgi:plasmid stability protein
MPNQRAAGVTVRNIAVDDQLWQRTKEKAAAEGVSAAEKVRRLLKAWLDE